MSEITPDPEKPSRQVPEPTPNEPADLPDAAKRFYERYKDWVDEQNARVAKYGVFGEEFRPW